MDKNGGYYFSPNDYLRVINSSVTNGAIYTKFYIFINYIHIYINLSVLFVCFIMLINRLFDNVQ